MGPGSFPRFRMSTQPKPSSWAREGPNRKPRESRPIGESQGIGRQLRVPTGQGWVMTKSCLSDRVSGLVGAS